jgi:hypothetical protein
VEARSIPLEGRDSLFSGAHVGAICGHEARTREDELRRDSERWRPYRGLALVYAYAEPTSRKSKKLDILWVYLCIGHLKFLALSGASREEQTVA